MSENLWGLTPEQEAQRAAYWRAHNARCRELNRQKYGDGNPAQLVIYVRLGRFEYRLPLPVYRSRRAAA